MEKIANIFVTCAPKISDILEEEIRALGFSNTVIQAKGVMLKGSMADCMRLNLHLRTANKVLWEVSSFQARTPEHMYKHATAVKWEQYISAEEYISIDSYVINDEILDTRFANLKYKDAVVDRLTKVLGERPNSGPLKTNICLFIHWIEHDCTLYFDTSGETISKHGYRKIPGSAPLQETLAAAIILRSKWDMKMPFVNPMCGSGTLAIEAALLATNTAPGLFRSNFGFMHLLNFNEKLWIQMVDEAKTQIKDCHGIILATDISGNAIKISNENAKTAGMDHCIKFQQCDFSRTEVPAEPGIVMLNPEYGERLGEEEDLKETYHAIGDFFKKDCPGYWGYIFTGNKDLGKNVGLRTKRKIEFFNAQIECRLLEYELYAGSKKLK